MKRVIHLRKNTFTDYSEHRLEFIYFERGANVSNCHLKFNMPPVPKGSVRITKQITNTDKQKYANAEFSFKAYIQGCCGFRTLQLYRKALISRFGRMVLIRMKVVLLEGWSL